MKSAAGKPRQRPSGQRAGGEPRADRQASRWRMYQGTCVAPIAEEPNTYGSTKAGSVQRIVSCWSPGDAASQSGPSFPQQVPCTSHHQAGASVTPRASLQQPQPLLCKPLSRPLYWLCGERPVRLQIGYSDGSSDGSSAVQGLAQRVSESHFLLSPSTPFDWGKWAGRRYPVPLIPPSLAAFTSHRLSQCELNPSRLHRAAVT